MSMVKTPNEFDDRLRLSNIELTLQSAIENLHRIDKQLEARFHEIKDILSTEFRAEIQRRDEGVNKKIDKLSEDFIAMKGDLIGIKHTASWKGILVGALSSGFLVSTVLLLLSKLIPATGH